jgi:hypothetical protein
MKRQFARMLTIGAVLTLALAACSPMAVPAPTQPPPQAEATLAPADITVTMVGGTCNLEGTRQVYPDTFRIALVGGDQSVGFYGLAVVSLADGKTLADLEGAGPAQPPWVRLLTDFSTAPGQRTVQSVKVDANPVFVVCFTSPPDKAVGALGPIEIALPQAAATKAPTPEPTATLPRATATQAPTPKPTATLPPADITARISGTGCKLDAPKPTYPATFTIALVGEANKAGYAYGLTVISLAEGKTLEDLKQSKGTTPPVWVTVEGAIGGDPGLTTQATVTVSKGPIYMVCWISPPDRVIGRLGPVEIAK